MHAIDVQLHQLAAAVHVAAAKGDRAVIRTLAPDLASLLDYVSTHCDVCEKVIDRTQADACPFCESELLPF